MTAGRFVIVAVVLSLIAGGVVLVIQDSSVKAVATSSATEESDLRFETPKVFPSGFRLQVEHHLNTDFLTYHVSTRVTASTIEDIVRAGADSPNRELLRDLHEVDGVGNVFLRPYEVTIQKGQVFDWYEMLPMLETVIRRHLEPRVDITGKTGTSEPHR